MNLLFLVKLSWVRIDLFHLLFVLAELGFVSIIKSLQILEFLKTLADKFRRLHYGSDKTETSIIEEEAEEKERNSSIYRFVVFVVFLIVWIND